MTFLLIYTNLELLGGIETLIDRMAAWLIKRGHGVTLLVEYAGSERRLLPPGLRLIESRGHYRDLFFRGRLPAALAALDLDRPDVIKAFDAKSTWVATLLSTHNAPNVPVMSGCTGGPVLLPSPGQGPAMLPGRSCTGISGPPWITPAGSL